ncbi:hypothetical protein EJD97_018285 [Solanum chilense]|uniref:Uncharacterized protein n=1 Tax=Solanum chilense TaxID=4083 RepID=A0A6N2B197_SOLCI|nr:hypothetical protein EJD97_018285 [Solanum chilense]
MSDPSSASKQMLTNLSEIKRIAFYSLSAVGSRSNIPSSSSQDILENPFHSIYLNNSSVLTRPGRHHKMLSDALFEGDLPSNRSSKSNILAASEELVIESLAMMREEVRVEQNEPFQGEEIRETQPMFDKTPDFGRYLSSNSSDSASDDESIQWKVERRDVSVSKKEKEKVVEEVSRRRPTTRSDTKILMADALKVSAEETEKRQRKNKSGKTKSRDTKKAEKTKSTKESSKGKRKRSEGPGTQRKIEEEVNKQETVDNLRKQSVLAGRVFDMGIINLRGMDSLNDMEDGSVHTRVNDIAVHLDEFLLGKILKKLPTTKCAGVFRKVMKRIMLEHMYKTVIERKGIHGMGYGYFLTEVFKYINIPLSVGKSKMAQLIEDQDQLKHKLEELTMRLSGKDAEIAILKTELLNAETEGPGTAVVQALERENTELRAKVIALQEKAIKDNDAANGRLTLIIQSLSHQPPPS